MELSNEVDRGMLWRRRVKDGGKGEKDEVRGLVREVLQNYSNYTGTMKLHTHTCTYICITDT